MAKAKGTTFVLPVRVLRSQRQRAAEILPVHLHHYLDSRRRVLHGAWYPEEDLLEMLRAIAVLRPEKEPEVYRMMGRESVRSHLDGVYRHLAKLSDVGKIMPSLWESQHDSGRLILVNEGAQRFRYEIIDFSYPSREMCELLTGYYEELLATCGYLGITVTEEDCRLKGDRKCSWRCEWSRAPSSLGG